MKLALAISSLIALSTCVPLSAYSLTRESIQEKVNGHCLLESASQEAWKQSEDKFKKSSDSNLVSPFKELHEKIKPKENLNGNELKNTCLNLYSWDSSSIFKSEDKSLTEQIKTHCSLTIEERLGSDNKIEESKIESRIQKLSPEGKENEKLSKFLGVNSSSNKKDIYKKSCEELYKKPFLSEKSKDWMLVENYCKKDPS